jgi:hypothetical protein
MSEFRRWNPTLRDAASASGREDQQSEGPPMFHDLSGHGMQRRLGVTGIRTRPFGPFALPPLWTWAVRKGEEPTAGAANLKPTRSPRRRGQEGTEAQLGRVPLRS